MVTASVVITLYFLLLAIALFIRTRFMAVPENINTRAYMIDVGYRVSMMYYTVFALGGGVVSVMLIHAGM